MKKILTFFFVSFIFLLTGCQSSTNEEVNKAKARDVARKAYMTQLSTTLEAYLRDNWDYPNEGKICRLWQ